MRYNARMTRSATPLLVLVLAALAAVGVANAAPSEQRVVDGSAELADMRTQLEVLEFADVADKAQRMVDVIEERSDRYDMALVEPLTLLGDARMGMDDPTAALAAYDRAKHITRIGDGVQSLNQLDLLYREAAALDASGDRRGANERHELAYSLRKRSLASDDLEMLPGIYDLIAWYRHHYKFRASQILYEAAFDIVREHYEPDDPELIGLLRGYVDTFRQRRFGAREAGRGGFFAWPPGASRDPPWYQIRSYIRGKKALREVLELIEAKPDVTDTELADAVLELADWHLLYGEYGISMRYYRRVWALLQSDNEALAAVFANPTPLYVPLPDKRTKQVADGADPDGVVILALTITHRGDVVGRKTLRAEPSDVMEFKVRKAAKRAVYRPAFTDADPVRWNGLELEYRYEYLGNALGWRQ